MDDSPTLIETEDVIGHSLVSSALVLGNDTQSILVRVEGVHQDEGNLP